MEPFNLALNQVNFEEQDIHDGEQLDSFSNLCHYDSEFKDEGIDNLPVVPRRVLPTHTGARTADPNADYLHSALKKNPGASYLYDSYNAYMPENQPGQGTRTVAHHQQQPTEMKSLDGAVQQGLPKSVAFDPHEDSFVAFTDTVEALALQKSVIGTSGVKPASEDEVARVIAQTKARISGTTADTANAEEPSVASATLPADDVNKSLIITQSQHHEEYSVSQTTEPAVAPSAKQNAELMSLDQLAANQVTELGDEGATIEQDVAAPANEDAALGSGDPMAANQSSRSVTSQSTVELVELKSTSKISTNIPVLDIEQKQRSPSPCSPNYLDDEGKHVELIRVPPDEITMVVEKKGSWFSSKSPVSKSQAGNPASPRQAATPAAGPVSLESPSKEPVVESGVGVPASGDHVSSAESWMEITTTVAESKAEGLVVVSHETKGSATESTRDGVDHYVVPNHLDPPTPRNQENTDLTDASRSKAAGPQQVMSQTTTSSIETRSSTKSSCESAVQSSQSKTAKQETSAATVLYPLKPIAGDAMKEKLTTELTHVESRYTEHHSEIEHVKKVIQVAETSAEMTVPETPDSSFNISADLISQDLDQALREKAKLEGQVEVMAAELKVVVKERAELQTKLATLEQHLKAQESSTQGIAGDRDELEANLKVLRQNRARLELVVLDAHKLLEDKDAEIKTLQEDLQLAQEATEKTNDKIVDLHAHLQARDNTVEDLKSKVAELYVDFQTTNQNKILAESEIKSLQGEIKSLKTGKEWYQDQLHLSQQAKSDLQKQVTEVKGEMIMQGTLIEKLKADNARFQQQLTETQQKAIHEKEMLARHLETIEADMVEREATFVQIQRERQNMEQALHTQDAADEEHVPADVAEDLRKSKSELRRKGAQVGMLEHEQSELLKRLTLSQESLLERDRNLELLGEKYMELEVSYKQLRLDLEAKEQELLQMKDGRSAVEVELAAVKEEKKTFDAALQTLKDDMGKVEKSFKFMKQELDAKKEELTQLKSEKQKSDEKMAETTRAEVHQELLEELKQGSEVAVHKESTNAKYDTASLEEIQLLKSQNSALELLVKSLEERNTSAVRDLENAKYSSDKRVADMEGEILLLKGNKRVDGEERLQLESELMSGKERLLEMDLSLQSVTEDKARLEAQLGAALERLKSAEHTTQTAVAPGGIGDHEIERVRDINTELRSKLADLQRESHKEIAKQKAKVLKLGKDLEMTLREHRETQNHLQARTEELSAKYATAEEARKRLEGELSDMQNRFSMNLDEKTQQLQIELQNTKTHLTALQEQKQATETELRELRHTYTKEVEIYREKVSVLEVEVRTTKEQVTIQKQAMDNSRQLMLELEKEKGKLAGIIQNHTTLKEHTSSLEHQLAKRESSVVELSSHANEEMMKKDKEIVTLRERLKEYQELWDSEKQSLKDTKKQLMTEKGSHVKLKHKMESLMSEHVQVQAELKQKYQELDLVKSRFEEMLSKELKYKSDIETLRCELQEAQTKLGQLRVQSEERKAKDPVIEEHIKTLEWQIEEKTTELTAVTQQLHMVKETQTTELERLKSTLQSNSGELSSLREELVLTKQEKSALQAKVVELKAALSASVQQAKSQETWKDGPALKPGPEFDIAAIESLLQDARPAVVVQSKPLTFLQATLSGLRGEITTLQTQVDEHTTDVQHSSMAWKEIEEQVRDLREVCKSSAAGRLNSQGMLTATPLAVDERSRQHNASAPEKEANSSKALTEAEKVLYV